MLAKVWDAQNAYKMKHGGWAKNLKELGWTEPGVSLEVTTDLFEATYHGYKVDQSLRFWKAS